MAGVDRAAPVQFLAAAFEPEDWVAIFLKCYDTNSVTQRVGPVSWVQERTVSAMAGGDECPEVQRS
jgi:hypothetical protein